MRALVWFRADLRCDDNRALSAATHAADRGVLGVFLICEQQWQTHDWADIKVEFLLRNLACLSERLKKLKIPLLIRRTPTFEGVPGVLLDLVREHDCDALYFNHEYEVNEQRRDDAVKDKLCRAGVHVQGFHDQAIVPPGAFRTTEDRFYTVFTPFKRAWAGYLGNHADLATPVPDARPQAQLSCAPDTVPESLERFHLDRGQPERWPAGEGAALRALTTFVERRIRDYKDDRDQPALAGTSRLSPYLTLGVLSPRRCLADAREANRGQLTSGRVGPATWISELVWREFYRHVLVGYPRVSMHRAFKEQTEEIPWSADQDHFAAWCAGRTGFPIVDAGMRELNATGWMHNRARMIVAMFLTKDLLIDWRWGERYFMRHLVDGDLASNNGGWQWSASTGTDAAPYFRLFNPYSQSKRYDPEGEYIRQWIPELADVPAAALHDPDKLTPALREQCGYAAPLCDHGAARERALAVFKAL